jgi:mono/diheme cytochrome c family protein
LKRRRDSQLDGGPSIGWRACGYPPNAHTIRRLVLVLVWSSVAGLGAASPAVASDDSEPRLHFIDFSGESRSLSLSSLRGVCDEEEVDVADPYHERRMRYVAMPLKCVLDAGFEGEGGAEGQRARGLLLRALDGYIRPVSGRDLLEPGAFLAFGEPGLTASEHSRPAFAKIDRRGIDPGPFYLVWVGATQNDPHVHPWPYQLSTIQVAPFAEAFPKTVPSGLEKSDPGWAGYALFQRSCASCHAINGEGGKVGPDLNVPRSIVEYRPLDQIRSYIRNPQATRYTSMPAQPDLSEADLDALIAYFSAMSQRKNDPGHRGAS